MPQATLQLALYSCNVNQLGLLLLSPTLDGLLVHRRVTPSFLLDRQVGVKFVAYGDNTTMQGQTVASYHRLSDRPIKIIPFESTPRLPLQLHRFHESMGNSTWCISLEGPTHHSEVEHSQ